MQFPRATSERLRAEAHGHSLPWSDPVKTAAVPPAPPKLTFTPSPADAPAGDSAAGTEQARSTAPQAAPGPAPARPQDSGERPRVRLVQSDGQPPPPEDEAQIEPLQAPKRARPPEAEAGRSRAWVTDAAEPDRSAWDKGARADIKLAPSSRRAPAPKEEVQRPRARMAEAPRRALPPVEEDRFRSWVAEPSARLRLPDAADRRSLARTADMSGRIRRLQEDGRPRSKMMEAPVHARLADLGDNRPRLRVADIPQQVRPPHRENGEPPFPTAEGPRPVPPARAVRNLPSLAAADDIRDVVRRAESRRERVSVALPYQRARYEDRDGIPRVREVYVVRSDDEPRVVVHRRVADSYGLMRWLSGLGGHF